MVVGGHVRLIQLALLVVHPGEGTAVCVVHQRSGLPVDSIRALLEQDVAEVHEGKFRKASMWWPSTVRSRAGAGCVRALG